MIIITGANGQLGYDIVKELNMRKIGCMGIDIDVLDITDSNAVISYISSINPEAVIHCAAYTAVDKAEDEVEKCMAVNVCGTENIALACKKTGAKMMYLSTDYVFPGNGKKEYEVDDEKGPKNVYGQTKLEGEYKVINNTDKYFIVRTSWVFGKNGGNFVKTMLWLSKTKSELNVVCDQIGSPTYTEDLASLVCDMIATEKYGIYHATNEGFCSWYVLAKAIFEKAGKMTSVNPVSTLDYSAKAARPYNSRLSKLSLDKAGFKRLPGWEDALDRYLKELKGEDA